MIKLNDLQEQCKQEHSHFLKLTRIQALRRFNKLLTSLFYDDALISNDANLCSWANCQHSWLLAPHKADTP